MFVKKEIAYIQSQRLARLATVADNGQPDVVSVGFKFDGECFYIGGMNPAGTRRHKNILEGNTRVALILDVLETVDPWSIVGPAMVGGKFTPHKISHQQQRFLWQ